MLRTKSLISFILVLLLPAQSGLSQTIAHRSRTTAKPKTTPNAAKYLLEPFDINTTNVGSNFVGHNIAAIVKAVTAAEELRAKSEFESSSQYRKRLASLAQPLLVGNVSSDDYLAFVAETQESVGDDPDEPMGSGSEFGYYDADKEIFTVKLVGNKQEEKDAITTRSIIIGRRVYAASNAYNAKITVTETNFVKYGLAFEPRSWVFPDAQILTGSLGDSRVFERVISMSPEKARLFLPNARVLIICQLVHDDWTVNSQGGKAATFDSPDSTNIEKRYLHVKPQEIWLIDGATGDVIRKFSDASRARDRLAEMEIQRNNQRQGFPLVVELSMPHGLSNGSMYVTIDDAKEKSQPLRSEAQIFYARNKVQLRWFLPTDLSLLSLDVNGRLYVPQWKRTNHEASTVIVVGK